MYPPPRPSHGHAARHLQVHYTRDPLVGDMDKTKTKTKTPAALHLVDETLRPVIIVYSIN